MTLEPDLMTGALERLDGLGYVRGPTQGTALANHGPMCADALVAMQCDEDVLSAWIDEYKQGPPAHDVPPSFERIDPHEPASCRAALGDYRRVADWEHLFRAALDEDEWRVIVTRWWPRLLPGSYGHQTHGLIRTAHAVRIVARAGTPHPSNLTELARGLAFWAASFSTTGSNRIELSVEAPSDGDASLVDAIARLPRPPDSLNGRVPPPLTRVRFPKIIADPQFERTLRGLADPSDVSRAFGDLTATLAGVFLAHPECRAGTLAHVVTAPAAARMALPYLPAELHLPTYRAAWGVAALLVSLFTTHNRGEPPAVAIERDPLSIDELAARAIDNGQEHAVKLTEACLREFDLNPDVCYLLAAQAGEERIRDPSMASR